VLPRVFKNRRGISLLRRRGEVIGEAPLGKPVGTFGTDTGSATNTTGPHRCAQIQLHNRYVPMLDLHEARLKLSSVLLSLVWQSPAPTLAHHR
jgi:hypothetical protein